MSNSATAAARDQNNQDRTWASNALTGYNNNIGTYMSNVNSTLAAGNPYESKSYLTNRNIATSGAMNAANTAGQQQLRDTALRTGTNTAAVANEIGANQRQGQRDLTNYNATADNANLDKWLTQQNQLRQQQLEGANSEAGVYGTATQGADSSLNSEVSAQNAKNQMDLEWAKLGVNAAGAALAA